jgi:hypothetical protein
MTEYVVQSGSLKIVLLAETALEAAIEAVLQWGSGDRMNNDAHRSGFAERIVVRKGVHGGSRQFPTFNVLAYASGESASEAWQRVLTKNVGGLN